MPIIKTTNQEIKIGFIYIKDIIILGVMGVFDFILNKILGLPFLFLVLQVIISLGFGMFLCFKPAKYGHERNIKLIVRLLKMDDKIYKFQKLVERESINELNG